jgi:hypothetical protein
MPFVGWSFSGSIKSGEYVGRLLRKNPPQIDIINEVEIRRHYDAVDRECAGDIDYTARSNLYHRGMPTPRLMVLDKTFQCNYFHIGLKYISARLKEIMDLPAETVSYLDVNLNACPAAVQSIDYKVLHLMCSGNPRYAEKPSDYMSRVPKGTPEHFGQWFELPQKDGSIKKEWLLTGPHALPIITGFKEDFISPAPLFLCEGHPMATDELAERVLRAGITDVAFYDITNDGTQTDLRWKTLA